MLPDQPGALPHLMVTAGKEGKIYLIDRDDLGAYQRCGPSCDDVGQVTPAGTITGGSFGAPGYFNNLVYSQGPGDVLKAFQLSNGLHAYDALDLSRELYAVKFTVPTVASGNVYVGTQSSPAVFGHLPRPVQTTATAFAQGVRGLSI